MRYSWGGAVGLCFRGMTTLPLLPSPGDDDDCRHPRPCLRRACAGVLVRAAPVCPRPFRSLREERRGVRLPPVRRTWGAAAPGLRNQERADRPLATTSNSRCRSPRATGAQSATGCGTADGSAGSVSASRSRHSSQWRAATVTSATTGTAMKMPGDPVQLHAGEHGQDDHQRMQVDVAADQARIDHVVFQQAQHAQKHGGPDRQHRIVQCGEHHRDERHDDRPNQRDEFQHRGQHAEQHRIRAAQQCEAEARQACRPRRTRSAARGHRRPGSRSAPRTTGGRATGSGAAARPGWCAGSSPHPSTSETPAPAPARATADRRARRSGRAAIHARRRPPRRPRRAPTHRCCGAVRPESAAARSSGSTRAPTSETIRCRSGPLTIASSICAAALGQSIAAPAVSAPGQHHVEDARSPAPRDR